MSRSGDNVGTLFRAPTHAARSPLDLVDGGALPACCATCTSLQVLCRALFSGAVAAGVGAPIAPSAAPRRESDVCSGPFVQDRVPY